MILTTGIGSIPLSSFQQAAEYVCQRYTLPFLPETLDTRTRLPSMLTHLLTDDEVQALEKGDWGRFRSLLTSHPDQFSQLYDLPLWESATAAMQRKAQMIGPMTLIALLANFFPGQHGSEIEEVALPFHRERFKNLLQAIGTHSETTYLTFDEPLMNDRNMVAVHNNLKPLLKLAADHKSLRLGIHCCAPIRLDFFAKEFPDLGLAFDMNQVPIQEAAVKTIARKQWLIFGIVDTAQSPIDPEKALLRARQIETDWLPGQAGSLILSGGCGTSRRTFFYEQAVAECLKTAAGLLTTK